MPMLTQRLTPGWNYPEPHTWKRMKFKLDFKSPWWRKLWQYPLWTWKAKDALPFLIHATSYKQYRCFRAVNYSLSHTLRTAMRMNNEMWLWWKTSLYVSISIQHFCIPSLTCSTANRKYNAIWKVINHLAPQSPIYQTLMKNSLYLCRIRCLQV